MWQNAALLLAAIVVVTPSVASAQPTLQWKLRAGDAFRIVTVQEVEIAAKLGDQSVRLSHGTAVQIAWQVTEVDPDSTATVSQTIERLKVKLKSPGMDELVYDTAIDTAPFGPVQQLAAAVQPLLKTTAALKINPRGRVSDVRLSGGAEAPRGTRATAAEAFTKFLTREGVLELSGLTHVVLPERAVKEGERWDGRSDLQTAAGAFRRVATYEWAGEETRNGRKLARIVVTWQLVPTDAAEARLPGEPERKPAARIDDQDNRGVILFDAEAGHPVEAVLNQRTTIVSPAGETEIKQRVTSETTMRMSRVADE